MNVVVVIDPDRREKASLTHYRVVIFGGGPKGDCSEEYIHNIDCSTRSHLFRRRATKFSLLP